MNCQLAPKPSARISAIGKLSPNPLAGPIRREVQTNGRIRFWGRIPEAVEARTRFLRVVTLEDGETVHNALFDRNFREGQS